MTTPIGTLAWAELSGGKLTFAEKFTLIRTVLMPMTMSMARAWLHLDSAKALDFDEIPLPDTAQVKSAIEELEACAGRAVIMHSWRTYLWGEAFGILGEIPHDPELLLIGSLLHDLGMSPTHHNAHQCQCFAVDGARAAGQWADKVGMNAEKKHQLGEMICLHLNAHVEVHEGAEAHLLQQGATCDVVGARYYELAPHYREKVLAQYPRCNLNKEFSAFIEKEATLRPHSRTALLYKAGMPLLIKANPFSE